MGLRARGAPVASALARTPPAVGIELRTNPACLCDGEEARAIAVRQRLPEPTHKCSAHFLTRRLPNVATGMSLDVLAYNLKRVMSILGLAKTMQAMKLVSA
jgi:hypothetical protein